MGLTARKYRLPLAALAVLAVLAANSWLGRERAEMAPPDQQPAASQVAAAPGLPAEVHETLLLIQRGGPFHYDRDGSVFQNREGRLPAQPRGYYREYTVPTPGAPDRGARRIVTGGNPPRVFYFTADHYRTFRVIEVER